jgi:type VI protein secretion system component Hcp
MSYKLINCIISKVKTSGGGDIPTELVTIKFGAIKWCYTQQKRQGGGPSAVVVNKDVAFFEDRPYLVLF